MGEMIFCRACGNEVHRTARSCPACGAPLAQKRYKDKTAAAVLAFFCGGFGFHRFYLGQWWGIFYLMTSCIGIPFFISFIEFIVFLCTSRESWDAKHNDGFDGQGSNSNSVVWVVVGLAVGVMMFVVGIGVIAGISIPAYQDHTKRTIVSSGLYAASPAKAAMAEYISSTGKFPPSMDALGIQPTGLPQHVTNISLDQTSQSIVVSYDAALFNKTLNIGVGLDNGQVKFNCYSVDIENRYLPQQCKR